MSVPAQRIGVEHKMNERTVLDEKVDHIQRDVTELKAEIKRVDAKLDKKVDALATNLAEHRLETEKSIGALRVEMANAFRSQTRWMIGIAVASVGSLIAVGNYYADRVARLAREMSREDTDTAQLISHADAAWRRPGSSGFAQH
jgi:chromosome segregation ATPase